MHGPLNIKFIDAKQEHQKKTVYNKCSYLVQQIMQFPSIHVHNR